MTDNQKWLEAAAGLEQDIVYLKSALVTATSQAVPMLKKGIERLRLAVAVFRSNAAAGMRWPSGAELLSIDLQSSTALRTAMYRQYNLAN
jgi:hypothetical protein